LLNGIEPLVAARKLGVLLLVLAPSFTPERNRIEQLDAVIEKFRPHVLAVELRDRAWISGQARAATLGYFRERGLVWVGVDMPKLEGSQLMPAIDEVTNPNLAYLRLHGRNPQWLKAKSAADRHLHDYAARELKEIVVRVRRLAEDAKHVHVVANNHARDFAPKAALALKELLEGASP
jgi:uncharacterized protein YecE (DUF72 family)